AKTEDRQMYNQREKALRDYEWTLAGAREEAHRLGLEKGLEQGLERGLEQGLEQGLERGLERGREQGIEIGAARGSLAGKIQLLQELLGDAVASDAELHEQSLDELRSLLGALQERMRHRDA
ncbi:MAG: hypothetical protein R3C99_28230, partial [Pirellulaceae bacterium]